MRIFLISCFFLTALFSSNTKKDLKIDTYFSDDNITYKGFRELNFKKKLFKDAFIKIKLDKKNFKNKTIYLKIFCDLENIDYSNFKYQSNLDYIIVRVDQNIPKELHLNLKFKEPKLLKFTYNKLSEFEYKYILKKEYLLYGLAYGIIFCAFLYNFIIFFYYPQKLFLYYSLMQLFLIAVLYYAVLFNNQNSISDFQQILADFFETLCLLMMLLFSKEILNTKKQLRVANKIFNLLIYISVVDLITIFIFNHSLVYEYMPRSLIIVFLMICGLFAIYKGQRVAIFYFFAWIVIFVCLLVEENDFFDITPLYILHIGLPLESFILSFAVGYNLKRSMDEKKEKEKMLIQQSKLASMGEMLNNIAHQWRQPLNNLSFMTLNLKMISQEKNIDGKHLDEIADDSLEQINFMSETLDNFKGFYQPNRKKEDFLISEVINSTINIIKSTLESESIKLEFIIKNDKKVRSYKNELSQVILNLLTNSKDALVEKQIKKPQISITLDIDKRHSIIEVCDNAGGINKDIINKIFEPYFSTKHQNSGIGLYMSKIIVESHFYGEINVSNSPYGACFNIKF